MSDDIQWSDEIEERIDKLEADTKKLGTSVKFVAGGSLFLGLGVAVLTVTMMKVVKGFNQVVPAVNGLVELANAAQQAAAIQAPRPMPATPYNPDGGNLPVFHDGTTAGPVQEGWDPGEREAPDHVRQELLDLGGGLDGFFTEAISGGEPLPSNENIPDL